jgi:Tn7-like transposition protein D/TniQ
MYSNTKSVLNELFGANTATAIIDLPNRLSHLVAAFPAGSSLTVNRLINRNTLLPFFGAFLPAERVKRIQEDMRISRGPASHMRSGIMASRIPMPEYLRFCTICKKDDEENAGETYWHRLHQLPGVKICPIHQIFIENSNASLCAERKHLTFISAEQAIRAVPVRYIDLTNHDHQILLQIARNARWLLKHPCRGTSPEALHNRYLRLLIGRELATYTGSIHVKQLMEEFNSFYSPAFLKLLHCELRGRDLEKSNWLLRLVRGSKYTLHPLYHLLMMKFLGSTAEDFFQLPEELNFFGESPWPCLNPAADHYKQQVIAECCPGNRLRNNKPVGIFSCECGFSYARTGPDLLSEDRLRISKMISFGPIWEAKLKELWKNSALSLSEVGRRLDVDPLTVRRHATRLNLFFSTNGRRTKSLSSCAQLKNEDRAKKMRRTRKSFRAKWLSVMKQKSKITLKSLRKALPKIYAWLLQNDSKWLKRNCPKSVKHKKVNSSVDWKSRDAQHAVLVKQSAARIRSAPGRPVRITRTAIGRDLGVVSLFQKHLRKMPLTCRMLVSSVESSEGFSIRRIWWAADRYLEEGVCPQRWQLILRANVYMHREALGVRDAIQAAMKKLDSEGVLPGAATA